MKVYKNKTNIAEINRLLETGIKDTSATAPHALRDSRSSQVLKEDL